MVQALKRKSLKALLPYFLVTAIICVLLLGLSLPGLLTMIGGPSDFSQLDLDQSEGEYVSIEANQVIVACATLSASNDSGSKVLETYYLFPAGDGSYIAVMDAEEANAGVLDRAMSQSQEYYMGDLETLYPLGTLSGTILPLEEDMDAFMVECIEKYQLPGYKEGENTYKLIRPYQLVLDKVGFLYSDTVLVLALIGFVFLAATLVLIIPAAAGAYQKKAAAIIRQNLTAEEMDTAFSTAKTIERIQVGQYIWYQKGASSKVLKTADIIWGYSMPEPLVVSKYRWPVALYDTKQNFYQICFMDKKNREIFLNAIASQGHPFIDTYTSELSQRFKLSYSGFAADAAKAADARTIE